MYESKITPIYQESQDFGNCYRLDYLRELENLVERKKQEAAEKRIAFGLGIAADREKYRMAYRDMLGWPLNVPAEPIRSVEEIPVYEDEHCVITRVRLEVFEGFRFYGIRFTHKSEKPLPYVIVQHGGLGTPELCSSFFNSCNYNDMTLRIFRRGVNVFAPQTALWNREQFGEDLFAQPGDTVPYRQRYDKALRQLGGSIAALEIYCISRCLDYLETLPSWNGRFGMAGLSYGGFYTLYTAAAEPRIHAALTSSHFNDRLVYNWPDKVWQGAANTFLDAEVGALVCPRYLRIETGDQDPLFHPDTAQREYARLKAYYAEAPEKLHFHIFPGSHEFCPEDTGVEEFVAAVLA